MVDQPKILVGTTCLRCGAEILDGRTACEKCGTAQIMRCRACDTPNPRANRNCSKCGRRLRHKRSQLDKKLVKAKRVLGQIAIGLLVGFILFKILIRFSDWSGPHVE